MNQKNKDSFIFYRSFYEALKELPKENQLNVYGAIMELSLNGKDTQLQGIDKTIFTLIKPQIEANNKRYENGSKGGRPKNQDETKPKPKDNQKITKTKPNKNVNDNVNDNYNNYGEFELVCLSQEKYEHYITVFGLEKLEYGIDKLDTWLTKQPKKQNQDHYGYFKKTSWVFDGYEEKPKDADMSWIAKVAAGRDY